MLNRIFFCGCCAPGSPHQSEHDCFIALSAEAVALRREVEFLRAAGVAQSVARAARACGFPVRPEVEAGLSAAVGTLLAGTGEGEEEALRPTGWTPDEIRRCLAAARALSRRGNTVEEIHAALQTERGGT